jgi:hypothetical protein
MSFLLCPPLYSLSTRALSEPVTDYLLHMQCRGIE